MNKPKQGAPTELKVLIGGEYIVSKVDNILDRF